MRFNRFLVVLCLFFVKDLYSQSLKDSSFNNIELCIQADSANFVKVRELIDIKGADPNTTAFDGITPLMLATQSGYFPVVDLLLRRGANPDIMPPDGNNALIAAVRFQLDTIAELLLKYKANPNVVNNLGYVPLHYAVWEGMPYLTDLLLYYKADPNKQDREGNTPLMLAVYVGAITTTEILLEYGADPNIGDNEGRTPLMVAAQYNDTLLCRKLLENNADIRVQDIYGGNALTVAITSNSTNVVKILLDAGAAKYNVEDSYYSIALEENKVEVLKLLDVYGLKEKPKIEFQDFSVEGLSYYNKQDEMLGFSVGLTDRLTKSTISLGYRYRPNALPVYYSKNGILKKIDEEQKAFFLKVNLKLTKQLFNTKYSYGVLYGGSLDWIIRSIGSNKYGIYPLVYAGVFLAGDVLEYSIGYNHSFLRIADYNSNFISVGIRINLKENKYKNFKKIKDIDADIW